MKKIIDEDGRGVVLGVSEVKFLADWMHRFYREIGAESPEDAYRWGEMGEEMCRYRDEFEREYENGWVIRKEKSGKKCDNEIRDDDVEDWKAPNARSFSL